MPVIPRARYVKYRPGYLVANQFRRPPVRYEDLVQEGTMGLIVQQRLLKPDRGIRFSTYSVYWIRAKIA